MYVAARVAIREYYVMFTYRFGLCDTLPREWAKWAAHMGRPHGPSHKGHPNIVVYYGM